MFIKGLPTEKQGFQNFLSTKIDKILSEGRKYGIHLILANQYLVQFMAEGMTRIKNSMLANAFVKICGMCSSDDINVMSKAMQCSSQEIANLSTAEFVLKSGNSRALSLKARDTGNSFLFETSILEFQKKLLFRSLSKYATPYNLDEIQESKGNDFELHVDSILEEIQSENEVLTSQKSTLKKNCSRQVP